jgi:hypothetical protein
MTLLLSTNIGTREFDGLKTLMALLHNVDLAETNTKIVRRKVGGRPFLAWDGAGNPR